MKVVILNEYRDKGLNRIVKVGEVLDLDEDRIKVLKNVGVEVEEHIDEDELSDDLDEDRIDNLLKLYQDDKNIVDELRADDLKLLCDEFDINYTNVKDAKEALKILTIG